MKRTLNIFSIAIVISLLVSVIGLSLTPVQAETAWQHVGPAGFSEGMANYVSLAFNHSTPYVAFMDESNGYKAHVMKFDGMAWVNVGPADASSGSASDVSLVFDNGTPYVAYLDADYGVNVMKFDGTTWENIGPTVFSGYAYSLAFDNGVPYVAYLDLSFQIRVVKFDILLGNWVNVGPVFSFGDIFSVSLAFDSGVPYVAFGDGISRANVIKFDGTSWVNVGPWAFSGGSARYLSFVFDDGVPFVAFRDEDNDNKASVMKFDASSGNWVNVGSAGFSSGSAFGTSLAFDNGVPYVAFLDDASGHKASVMKFDGTAWVNIGPADFSTGEAFSLSLALDSGVPYVAFRDGVNGNKISVMKYEVGSLVPAAPLNLSAVADNPNQVTLSWLDNADNEQGFHIERCSGANCTDFAWLADVTFAVGTGLTVDYVDSGLTPATSYSYRVAAFNQDGAGEFSNIDTAVTPAQGPLQPSNLTVTLLPNPVRVQLTWIDNSNNENQFRVWRSTDGGAFTQVGTISRSPTLRTSTGGTVTFTNNDLTVGSTYSYYVIAVNALPNPDEFSIPSDAVSVTVPTIPTEPTDLAGSAVRNGSQDLVTLIWTDHANNEAGFQIQRSTSPNFTTVSSFTVGPDVTTFSQNVSRTNDYYYRVRAGNATGLSAWSNVVIVITP